VTPVREVSIVVARELRKSFRSVKGILLFAFTVLGGGLLAYLLAQSDDVRQKRFAEHSVSAENVLTAKTEALTWWFSDGQTGAHVGHAPLLLVVLFSVSLWMVPAVVLVLGFDNVSGDLQHRTVRYWSLRTRRASYIAGKFFGLWATCAIVALAMHALIWVVVIARGEAAVGETISWGFRFWLASLPILSVWCGVSVLVSSFFRIPILALLLTGGVFFVWWAIYVSSWFGPHFAKTEQVAGEGFGLPVVVTNPVMFTFPNFYDRFLLSPAVSQTLIGMAVTMGFAAVCVALSSVVLMKRDV